MAVLVIVVVVVVVAAAAAVVVVVVNDLSNTPSFTYSRNISIA